MGCARRPRPSKTTAKVRSRRHCREGPPRAMREPEVRSGFVRERADHMRTRGPARRGRVRARSNREVRSAARAEVPVEVPVEVAVEVPGRAPPESREEAFGRREVRASAGESPPRRARMPRVAEGSCLPTMRARPRTPRATTRRTQRRGARAAARRSDVARPCRTTRARASSARAHRGPSARVAVSVSRLASSREAIADPPDRLDERPATELLAEA